MYTDCQSISRLLVKRMLHVHAAEAECHKLSAQQQVRLSSRAYSIERFVGKLKLWQIGFLAAKLKHLNRVCDHKDVFETEAPAVDRAVLFAPTREDLQACRANFSNWKPFQPTAAGESL